MYVCGCVCVCPSRCGGHGRFVGQFPAPGVTLFCLTPHSYITEPSPLISSILISPHYFPLSPFSFLLALSHLPFLLSYPTYLSGDNLLIAFSSISYLSDNHSTYVLLLSQICQPLHSELITRIINIHEHVLFSEP